MNRIPSDPSAADQNGEPTRKLNGPHGNGMRVSIVTVCFNSATTIEDTIRSVREQTYEEVEHIVVDGGSTDGTQEIVSRHNRRIQKFISEPDRGIYDAMNKGLRLARGDVVGFLNADDVYASPTAIGDIVAALQADHTDGAYGDLGLRGTRFAIEWSATGGPARIGRGLSTAGGCLPHPTFFCRTALYGELGGFDPAYRIAGDFELMLRFIEKNGICVRYVPKPLVRMRAGGRANTLRGVIQGNREIIQAFRRNGLEFSTRFFCTKLIRKVQQFVGRPGVDLFP